jgi:DNA polymerase V
MEQRSYVSIDLKSFYASVECVERGLDPLNTCLVVADKSRTDKTICLAVSPPLKARGVPGRPRLFEVIRRVEDLNKLRLTRAPGKQFHDSSYIDSELKADPSLKLDYITATPRMKLYMDYSRRIYGIYLRYLAPEDIHVYSVDEVMMDVTPYRAMYRLTPYELTRVMLNDVYHETGITATAGIGTNLYLSKVGMDIVAKSMQPDAYGMRIASLNEMDYRRQLWDHRPLTDFWRIGPGYASKLEAHGLYTMGDIARFSLTSEAQLYKMFGINAELLIDHAWGWEPCTMKDIKAYRPRENSLGSGQVLPKPYSAEGARLIVREMMDALALSLTEKGVVTNEVVLTLGYEHKVSDLSAGFFDFRAHGSQRLKGFTDSVSLLTRTALALYDRIVNPYRQIRRVNVTVLHVRDRTAAIMEERMLPSLFGTEETLAAMPSLREDRLQQAAVELHHRFGRSCLFKASSLCEGARTLERNQQVGGHRA